MPPVLPALIALALSAGDAIGPATPVPAEPSPAAPAPAPAAAAPAPTLAEGTRRYRVERIVLRGLVKAQEGEVRKYILVAEGDVLDSERVLLSRLRLLQLG